MKVETDDDRLILIAAFRYALGRKTYIVPVVADFIERNWKELSDSDRGLIHREIKEAIEMSRAGMQCDVSRWEQILHLEVEP